MDQSLFYQKRCGPKRSIPVSYLFLESLRVVVSEEPHSPINEAVSKAAKTCFNQSLSAEQQLLVVEELQSMQKKLEGLSEDSPSDKPSLGTAMLKWLSELEAEQLCYLLSEFDPVLAERLYCDTDYTVVAEMATLYTQKVWHWVNSTMEAAMYGFGGKYEEDDSKDKAANTFDLTKDPEAGLAQLKSMGF